MRRPTRTRSPGIPAWIIQWTAWAVTAADRYSAATRLRHSLRVRGELCKVGYSPAAPSGVPPSGFPPSAASPSGAASSADAAAQLATTSLA